MFGFKNILNKAKKVENKNIMEAVVAGCLLVAAADGTLSREETEKMEKMLNANDLLEAFKGAEIRKTVQRYTSILEADFGLGRKKMLDEIEQISDNANYCEEVILAMLAVAGADGSVDEKEKAVLIKVAQTLRLNLNEYGLA